MDGDSHVEEILIALEFKASFRYVWFIRMIAVVLG